MDVVSSFPKFPDGDVCILICGRTYQLHSHTLSRLSPYFKLQFDTSPGARLTAAARRDGATAYRFELNTYLPEQFGKFIRIKVNDNGKPQRDNYQIPTLEDTLGHESELEARTWDWLFGSFYGITPKFEDHNLATVLHSCMSLVDTADSIGSINHVREIVDLALLRQHHVLWRSVAANPTAWTELACRVHSKSIFIEGITHLVGLWPRMLESERIDLRQEVRALCERKHNELDLAKQVIDMRILGHYPSFLCRSHADKPQRTSYSSDIYMWMSISFFRHFYAQAISENKGRTALDGGWKFYNAVAKGGGIYLNHEDFEAFYQYFPMSSKACNVLEANMNVLKEEIKVFVKDLMISRVHVQPEDSSVDWLTCTVVEKKDLPWEVEDALTADDHERNVQQLIGGYNAHSEDQAGLTGLNHLAGTSMYGA